MPSFDQTFSFSEPTVFLPPSHLSHPFRHQPFNTSRNIAKFSTTRAPAKSSPPASWGQQSQTPITSSRKRSRDDASTNLNDEGDYFASSPILAPETEDEWQYGEGMTLIRPNGFIIDASSQTGTWAEEKAAEQAEKEQSHTQIPTERPIARSSKFQRLDRPATSGSFDEVASEAGSPPKSSSGPDPTVDNFTIHLGIGWNQISNDEHIQAASRGWAKFIENNYPVTSPIIRLESRGLNSYLVEATEGFFLFAEDLKQGRLVSHHFTRAIQNLQVNPPIFDGSEILIARSEATTSTNEKAPEVMMIEITNESAKHDAVTTSMMDIDMDMN